MGRWEDAVAEYDSAMRLEPRNPGPAVNAAATYSRLRRYEQSVKAWNRAIELAPDDQSLKMTRGHVFLRWRGTVDSLEAAMRSMPGWDLNGMGTWSRYVVASMRSRHDEALKVLNASRHSISTDAFVYKPHALLRGQTYDALGARPQARASYESARALLTDSIAVHPKDPRLHVAIGLALAGLGRKQDALRETHLGLDLAPLASNYYMATAVMGGAAEVFAKAGDSTAALELLELLLAMPAGREVSVPLLRVDPAFDPLRTDPRFDQLLKRFTNT
jgi:tetratricopeptide (TPR) repeat protein